LADTITDIGKTGGDMIDTVFPMQCHIGDVAQLMIDVFDKVGILLNHIRDFAGRRGGA